MKSVSLVISVYNNVRALELILNALSIQTEKGFEVLIADDGSGPEMQGFIEIFKAGSGLNINHVYQADKGFRKTKILNEAVKRSKSDYLIFIDGDCIPHSKFIAQHSANKEKNTVLCGRRVNLSKRFSDKITTEKILNKEVEKIKLTHVLDSWRSRSIRTTHVEEGLFVKNKIIRKFLSKGEPHIVGCNFSLNRQSLEKINGFDENYTGPGIGEDSDIEFRLRLSGCRFKSIRNLAILFHLHHPVNAPSKQNAEYFEKVTLRGNYVTDNGLEKVF